jgi:hypothetical protein
MAYAAGYILTVVAVVLALVAHGGGKGAGMPPSGDWSAIGDRLIAGEVTAVFAWGFLSSARSGSSSPTTHSSNFAGRCGEG